MVLARNGSKSSQMNWINNGLITDELRWFLYYIIWYLSKMCIMNKDVTSPLYLSTLELKHKKINEQEVNETFLLNSVSCNRSFYMWIYNMDIYWVLLITECFCFWLLICEVQLECSRVVIEGQFSLLMYEVRWDWLLQDNRGMSEVQLDYSSRGRSNGLLGSRVIGGSQES